MLYREYFKAGELIMEKHIEVSILWQIYGKLLTEKQYDVLNDYYNNDLSLSEIAENLGYSFMPSGNGTSGIISISDELEIVIRYFNGQISKISISTDINGNKIDCTRNTTKADNMSVDLQTCVLIIKDIKQKLM